MGETISATASCGGGSFGGGGDAYAGANIAGMGNIINAIPSCYPGKLN